MTGNELLAEYALIAGNDFNPVLSSTTAFKLIHFEQALRQCYKAVRKIAKPSYVHAGGDATVSLEVLSPRLLSVRTVKLSGVDSPLAASDNDFGWRVENEGTLAIQDLGAGTYTIEGYSVPARIAATDTAITDIDERLFAPIVKLAVFNALGAHEETPEQMRRRADLSASAYIQIEAVASEHSRTRFYQRFYK